MSEETQQNENGQNLLIFAVLMVVLVALAGLVIDGGFALSKRREAQNAADAGALAGAEALCNGNADLATTQALDYAVNRNHAAAADVTVATETITVTTTIPHQTFFMSLFGNDVVTTTATASAGCYVPCTVTGVLPVAWFCPDVPESEPQDCGIKYPPLEGQSGELYVIMDSIKTIDDVCQDPVTHLPAGGLNCDPDNDGINEILAGNDTTGGNRSWLDLDGSGGGTNQLKQWVLDGFGGDLNQHTWFAGQSGVANDVFQAVGDIKDTIVLLPVFDEIPCHGLPDTNCPELYHTKPPDKWQDKIVVSNGTSQIYYHVIAFSAFYITCVEAPGIPGNPDCPGKNAAIAANPQIPENTKTIEGYFVKYDAGSGKCEGPDAGVHTMYLNK